MIDAETIARETVKRLREQKAGSTLDWRRNAIPITWAVSKNIFGTMDNQISIGDEYRAWFDATTTASDAVRDIIRTTSGWEHFVFPEEIKASEAIAGVPISALRESLATGRGIPLPYDNTIFQTYETPKMSGAIDDRLAVDAVHMDFVTYQAGSGILIASFVTSSWSPDLCLASLVHLDEDDFSVVLSIATDIDTPGNKTARREAGARVIARVTNIASILHTKETITERYETSKTIQRIRRSGKKIPRPAVTYVRHIQYKNMLKLSPGGGTHASPREHTRCGHWRSHPSGRSIWVRPAIINKGVGPNIPRDHYEIRT